MQAANFEMGLLEPLRDIVENYLCESIYSRSLNKVDWHTRGCWRFYVDDEGRTVSKLYEIKESWEIYPPSWPQL